VTFAADVIVAMLSERGPDRRSGLDDLRAVLRDGPGPRSTPTGLVAHRPALRRRRRRTLLRREDVACLVALNVPANELASLIGDHTLTWATRTNRALY